MKSNLGKTSFLIAILAGVITVYSWSVFFPFTHAGIVRLMLFTFVTCLLSFCLGVAGLFREEGRILALLGIIISIYVIVTLVSNVG